LTGRGYAFDVSSFVDPVSAPDAYQRMLLGLLGDADPAAVQAQTPRALRALVDEAGDDLKTRPEPKEWSVYECLAHAFDAEWVVGARYRWILAHDEPDLLPYDQDLWVDRLHAGTEPVDELLSSFDALRAANLALWRRTPVEERSRFGIHRERGAETYELTFRLLAGHDIFHLDQARRALANVRGSG
jgi:DinB superfamily